MLSEKGLLLSEVISWLWPRARYGKDNSDRERWGLLSESLVSCSGTISGSLLLIKAAQNLWARLQPPSLDSSLTVILT